MPGPVWTRPLASFTGEGRLGSLTWSWLYLHSQALVRKRSLVPFQTTGQQNLLAGFGRSLLNLQTSMSQKETPPCFRWVCAYLYACVRMYICARRSEVELGCLPLSLSTLSFEAGALIELGAHYFSWPLRPQDPLVSASPTLGLQKLSPMCVTFYSIPNACVTSNLLSTGFIS